MKFVYIRTFGTSTSDLFLCSSNSKINILYNNIIIYIIINIILINRCILQSSRVRNIEQKRQTSTVSQHRPFKDLPMNTETVTIRRAFTQMQCRRTNRNRATIFNRYWIRYSYVNIRHVPHSREVVSYPDSYV